MAVLQRASLTVELGILTAAEFQTLTADEQAEVTSTTERLVAQYGRDKVMADRDRHRAELSLAYGCC